MLIPLYIDTCCWGRPWDSQDQERMVAEADAVETILDWRHVNGYSIVASRIIENEMRRNPNAKDRDEIMAFYKNNTDRRVYLAARDYARARELRAAGLRGRDHYHLAAAERAGAVALLTVDVNFLKTATNKNLSVVKVINPLTFMGGQYGNSGENRKPH